MTLDEILERVNNNLGLQDVIRAFGTLDSGVALDQRHAMAVSNYVKRLNRPVEDPALAPLVDIVNERFVKPLFAPGQATAYEPKSIVFGLGKFADPVSVRGILTQLLARPSLQTLETLVANGDEETVLTVLAALVGRTLDDLYLEAGGRTPRNTRLQRLWSRLDAIVQGAIPAPPAVGALAPELRRPIELRDGWAPTEGPQGWERLQHLLQHGLPYEFMVLQRMVGTAFGTAQNASSESVADYLSDLFLLRHAAAMGLPFLRTIDGPIQPYPPYVTKEQMETLTGVIPSPDIAFVRRRGDRATTWMGTTFEGYRPAPAEYRPEDVVAVIESKVASDGGTARQKCDELRRQFGRVANRPGMLTAALVGGNGWNQRRAEVARLTLEISGQLYQLAAAETLVQMIRSRI